MSAAPGANFAVPELNGLPGDADGLCGRVIFPTQLVGAVEQLREDVIDAELGMPKDLNGDAGVIDALDHAANYRLLPVRVRVEWQGAIGPRRVDIQTILCLR